MHIDQIHCPKHPQEFLTNFCFQEGCNVALCATCICRHTQQHSLMKTQPHYENIKETYLEMNQRLNSHRNAISTQKSRLKNLLQGMNSKKKAIRDLIETARNDTIVAINKYFDQAHHSFEEQLEKQKQKTCLNSEFRLQQLYSELNQQAMDVYTISEELNSNRFPSVVHKIQYECMKPWKQKLDRISSEITNNGIFDVSMNYQPSLIHQLKGVIKKMLITSYKYPHPQKKESIVRRTSPHYIQRMSVGNKQNSMMKSSGLWDKRKIQTNSSVSPFHRSQSNWSTKIPSAFSRTFNN